MSGQYGQGRIQKTSPNSSKQGPMRATIPMSSVYKPNSNLKSGSSPTISPNSSWKIRASPDHSSGQRSPGSSAYKGKSKTVLCNREGNAMRRTASLDTIYLKGRWPRDNFYFYIGTLQVNKATQTEDSDWSDPRKIRPISETDEKLGKVIIRPKLRKENSRYDSPGDQTLDSSSQTLASCILSPTFKANPVNIPMKPLPKSSIRNSVEGLNQEIERIVLKTGSIESHFTDRCEDYKFCQVTPEGHRAPLAELLRTRSRSVNTQTPSTGDFPGSCHSSGPPSRGSISPLFRRHMDSPLSETGDSQGSSPDQESGRLGTSPHINKFLAREPPDGCEKVLLKTIDDRKCVPGLEHIPQPSTFKLKPSLGSAFKILQPTSSLVEQEIPIVPTESDFN